MPTDERASDAPNSLVWKNYRQNRFIFNTGGRYGWRIGQESALTSGNYYCKGKHISINRKSNLFLCKGHKTMSNANGIKSFISVKNTFY